MASDFEKQNNELDVLRAALEQIAAVAHHGGLIGFKDEHTCLNEVRRLSLPWWDMAESSRLEVEQEEALRRGKDK